MKAQCPECESNNFQIKTNGTYSCWSCGHVWNPLKSQPKQPKAVRVETPELEQEPSPAVTAQSSGTETKAQKFERLSAKRLAMLKNDFRKLGNLANNSIYHWTEEQTLDLFAEISTMVATLKNRF